ncbi:hypothetical protein HDU78_009795 [Chytriomyces hyalinus]|nr:hypothetical protein HDU78_009795 [Chytriomyces hyalinus]
MSLNDKDDDWETAVSEPLKAPALAGSSGSGESTAALGANSAVTNSGSSQFTGFDVAGSTHTFTAPVKIMRRDKLKKDKSPVTSAAVKSPNSLSGNDIEPAKAANTATPTSIHKAADVLDQEKQLAAKEAEYMAVRRRIFGNDDPEDAGTAADPTADITKGMSNTRLSEIAIMEDPVLSRMSDPEYSRRPVTPPEYRRNNSNNGYMPVSPGFSGVGVAPGYGAVGMGGVQRMPSGPSAAANTLWNGGVSGVAQPAQIVPPPQASGPFAQNPYQYQQMAQYALQQQQLYYQQQMLQQQYQQQQQGGYYPNRTYRQNSTPMYGTPVTNGGAPVVNTNVNRNMPQSQYSPQSVPGYSPTAAAYPQQHEQRHNSSPIPYDSKQQQQILQQQQQGSKRYVVQSQRVGNAGVVGTGNVVSQPQPYGTGFGGAAAVPYAGGHANPAVAPVDLSPNHFPPLGATAAAAKQVKQPKTWGPSATTVAEPSPNSTEKPEFRGPASSSK